VVKSDDVTIEFLRPGALDGIYDFQRVDPDWIGAFRPSKIPTTDGAFGQDGEANFSVRQTTFGHVPARRRSPTRRLKGRLRIRPASDRGPSDAGETTFHLQRATVEWGP
jgi:hypothetical protein